MRRPRFGLLVPTAAAAAAALAGSLLLPASSARARTIDLLNTSGSPVGWTATVPDAPGNESLQLLPGPTFGDNFFFSLIAPLSDANTPLTFQFTRTAATAPPLEIAMEQLTNASTSDWTGLRTTVSPAGTISLQISAPGSSSFSISPFTTVTFADANSQMDWTGGTLARGQTLLAGSTAGGGLSVPGVVIVGSGTADAFSLTLTPLTAGPTPIPLPPAAGPAAVTLAGLLAATPLRRR